MKRPLLTSAMGQLQVGCPVCTIVPSHMLRHLAQNGPEHLRGKLLQTLQHSERLRGQRGMLAYLGAVAVNTPAGVKRRTIYNLAHDKSLPGTLAREEGDHKSKDTQVKQKDTL